MGKGMIEPPSDVRQMGIMAFQMFISFTEAGFNEYQAIMLIARVMAEGREQGNEENGSD